MILKLKNGDVKIELFKDVAPKHVERIMKLANDGLYDNVVFHRVIDGFMAQTGDVKFGNSSSDEFDLRLIDLPPSSARNLYSGFFKRKKITNQIHNIVLNEKITHITKNQWLDFSPAVNNDGNKRNGHNNAITIELIWNG